MKRSRTFFAFVLSLFVGTSHASGATNLLRNPGLEDAKPGALPPGWEVLVIGVGPKFTTDAQERHGGAAAVRVDAAEMTRSYLRSSEPILVVPGETMQASAWVKVKGVPAGRGTVILIGEFADAAGKHLSVEKFNVADVTKTDWHRISGSVQVPANAAQLRLRMGFSYSQGTCWWDDVTVTAKQPLVCRVDLPGGRLSPARQSLPVDVLNRERARQRVTVRAGDEQVAADLTGEPTQRVDVPVTVMKPGRQAIKLSLVGADEAILFEQSRTFTVPPPLTLAPPSPTHWVVEDGKPSIEGVIDVAVPANQPKGAALIARVTDPTGTTRAEWQAPAAVDGLNPFTLHTPALPAGEYKLVAVFRPANGKTVRVEQPWRIIPRAQSIVTLSDAGFPVVDGKEIFPLGIFNGGRFKEQADAGFNVTHAYNAVRIEPDWLSADQKAFDFIERTQSHGMRMLFMIPMKLAIEGDFDGVRRRIKMFRNHPALLAWDEEEGFARGDFKPDTLKRIRQILNEEDPHHPFMVGDSADVITRSRGKADFFPDAEMDLGMWWWYPFPLKPRAADALQGEDGNPPIAGAWDVLTPPHFFTHAATKKPLWIGIQSYQKPHADARYPTPAEYRAQAYLALVSGAKGLMWYGGSVTGGLFLKPEEGHWPELQKLVREIRDREAFWLSAKSEKLPVTPKDAPIAAVIKRTADGRTLWVAVNRGPDAIDATLAGDPHRFEPYGVLVRETPGR